MRPIVLVALFLSRFASAAPLVPAGDEPAREWNQPHGNAAGTACVDVAPLKAPPTERWRIKADELLAGPVVAQGKLFFVARTGGAKELAVVDPASGASLAKAPLDPACEVYAIAAGDGLAALFEQKQVQTFRLSGSELRPDKKITGAFSGEPTRFGAILFTMKGKGGGFQYIDPNAGKALPLIAKGFGRLGVGGDALELLAADEKEANVTLNRFPLLSATAPVKVGPAEALFTGPMAVTMETAQKSVLIAARTKTGTEWFAWFGGAQGSALLRKAGAKGIGFLAPPAATGSHLYGFDQEEKLIDLDASDASTTPLVEKEQLRKGAQIGAPSLARDTLFLGNWAVELGSRRILWCLETIEADGPAVPAGDELLVIRTKGGELVGFGNGKTGAKAAAGATTDPKAAAGAAPTGPATLPGTKPGLIRADGVFLPGKASALADGRWRLEPESGKALELDAAAVALVDTGKEITRVGEELAIFRACWAVLSLHHAAALVPVCEKYRDAKLYDDCQRLIEEAKQDGLEAGRVDELLSAIAGRTPAKLAEKSPVRKKCVDFESAARVKSAAEMVDAAKWCAAHDAKVAATVLFARATAASPAKPPDPALVTAWVPASVPPGETPEATAQAWLAWAQALLPSGGNFAELDDSTKRRISVTKFAKDAVILRSKNVLLLSRETDPATIGPCLARAEAAVRALQKLLGPSPAGIPATAPLEIRMHRTRAEYLADRIIGDTPMVWSAGCYSPSDGISRFYSKQEGDEEDPLAHTLHEVLAHEVTHHYVDRRWIHESSRPAPSGYWMVEGFAEFVAGQAVEMGRVGEAFDDATVLSLDKAAAAAREEQIMPLEYLMELDQKRFQKELEGGHFGPVQLHHSLKAVFMDKRAVFYAEATALTFFVMNRCGENGRKVYADWLVKHYKGEALQEPWKEVGFESLSAFQQKFKAFLAEL